MKSAFFGIRSCGLWTFHAWLLIALIFSVLACVSTRANIFYISDSSDTTNATSLRGAIIAANGSGGDNIIIITNNLYSLTIPGVDEEASFTGDLDITNGNLTIIGLANTNVIISATNLGDRVFHILPNAQLTLLNLIITGGAAPGNYYGYFENGEPAGAIYNQGTLFLENCVITNNSSGGGGLLEGNGGGTGAGDGGGIYNSGVLAMESCVVAGNVSGGGADGSFGGNGGGIFNSGMCQLNNCLICGNFGGAGGEPEGNASGFAGSGGSGGGICNTSEMTLYNCTVSDNFSGYGANAGSPDGLLGIGIPPGSGGGAGGDGAGIYSTGILTLNCCTVSGNSSSGGGNGYSGGTGGAGGNGGSGAGIYSIGTLALSTCTINGNSCGNGGNGGAGFAFLAYAGMGGAGGNGGDGGGIFNAGIMTLLACTVSGNSGGPGGIGADGEAGLEIIYEINPDGTITTNIIDGNDGIGGIGGNGGTGGISSSSTGASTADVHNVLIALNSSAVGGAGGQTETTNGAVVPVASGISGSSDLTGQFTSGGHNLISQTNGCSGFTSGANGDLVGSTMAPLNPMLVPLTNNGGFTATINLLPGSPAIDAGDDSVLSSPDNLTIDQRGEPRKFGAHVDIGAVEYNGLINGIVQPPILNALQPSGSGFQFTFDAATQRGYSVLASTNLTAWVALGSATETSLGLFIFEDLMATNYPNRFYTIRQP